MIAQALCHVSAKSCDTDGRFGPGKALYLFSLVAFFFFFLTLGGKFTFQNNYVQFRNVEVGKLHLLFSSPFSCVFSCVQLFVTTWTVMCSLPGFSVHGILQSKIWERVAISSSTVSSWPRGWTQVSCISKWILHHWATQEDPLESKWGGNSFSSVQLLSRVWLFATPWTTALQASLSITNSWSPPKPMSIESVMPSNHLILCRPLLRLPSIFPSIRVFSNESALRIRWPNYWSFSFNIGPSNEHTGFFRGTANYTMDWRNPYPPFSNPHLAYLSRRWRARPNVEH